MSRTIAVLAASALWATVLAQPVPARAQGAPEVLRERRHQDAMVSLYVRTRFCLRTAGVAALTRAPGDAAHVQHFMVTVCGDPFLALLRADGMAEDEARMTLVDMARTSYYEDVLRIPEPK